MLDFDARYRVKGWTGVAFFATGYSTRQEAIYSEDGGEIIEYEEVEDTNRAVVVMVGDDTKHTVDIADLTKLDEGEYCPECGQIGCCGGR
jgi:hypothetical protein